MTAIRRAWIECDRIGCEAQHPDHLGAETVADARHDANASGWSYRREDNKMRDICPSCDGGEPWKPDP